MNASLSSTLVKEGHSASATMNNSRKPKYSRFTQQELPAWKPMLTPGWVIAQFTLIGAFFIPLGLVSFSASERVVEYSYRYDDNCIPEEHSKNAESYIRSSATNKTCIRKWIVSKQMKAPIYIYYQLTGYHQNHRRYDKSRSDNQLRSKGAENDIGGCVDEVRTSKDKGYESIVPCGLIAWSLFNDTYKLSMKNNDLVINKKNIAWTSDRKKKFGSDVYPKNFQSGELIGGASLNQSIPLSEQEDLMVWMRTAALPTFRKLYGRIEVDLEAKDEIEMTIENNYNTYTFGGQKSLIFSTTTWIGGRNNFLGMAYLTVGGISLLGAVAFILFYLMKPRPLGDPSYLSWNK